MGIDWGLPNDRAWNADDISPWKPLALPWRFFRSYDKYPYLHSIISLFCYAPYLAWLGVRGRLDLACLPSIVPEEDCFADPFGAPGVLMAISRVLSVLMGLGIVVGVHALALRVHGDRVAALFAAGIAALSCVLVLYAHLGNLDVPLCFWFVLSLVFFVRILQEGHMRDCLGFGLAAGCALATKEGILGAYVLSGLAIYAVHLGRERGGARLDGRRWLRASFDRRLLVLAGSLLLVYGLANNVIFNWSGFVSHWELWLPSSERMQGYREGRFRGYGPFALGFLRSLRRAMGTPLLALCAAGVLYAGARQRRSALLLIPAVSYVLLSVAISAMAPPRFMLPLVPILAVFGGLLAARLVRVRSPLRIPSAALLAAVFGHALLYCIHVDLLLVNDSRYRAEAWLRENLATRARIGTWSHAPGLPRLRWLGFRPEALPREEGVVRALAETGPDYLVVTAEYPGPFPGRRADALRRVHAGALPYRVVWEGRGRTPLDRWFGNPAGWINPPVLILERAGRSPPSPASRSGR